MLGVLKVTSLGLERGNPTISQLCKIIEFEKTTNPPIEDKENNDPIIIERKSEVLNGSLQELLENTIQASLKRQLNWDEIIEYTDMTKIIPELMLALKRKTISSHFILMK